MKFFFSIYVPTFYEKNKFTESHTVDAYRLKQTHLKITVSINYDLQSTIP